MTEPTAKRTLRLLLAEARACQWEKSRVRVRDKDDEGGKPVGAPKSDPTADAALDPWRLRLRDEVKRGERALLHGEQADWLRAATALEAALDRWAGH